jgi:hypothetical protein
VSVLGPPAAGVGQRPRRRYGRGWLWRCRGRRVGHRRRRGLHGPGRRGMRRPRRRGLLRGRGRGLRGRDGSGLACGRYRGERLRRRWHRSGGGLSRRRPPSRRAVPPPVAVLSGGMGGGRPGLGTGDRRGVVPRAAPGPKQDEKRHAQQNTDSSRGQDDPAPVPARPTSSWSRSRIGLRRRQQRRVDQHTSLAARPSADVASAARGAVQTLVDVRFNAAPSHSPAKGSGGRQCCAGMRRPSERRPLRPPPSRAPGSAGRGSRMGHGRTSRSRRAALLAARRTRRRGP